MNPRQYILFFGILFLTVASCKIGDDDTQIVRDTYFFQQEISLTGAKKSYNVDDILWFEITIPDKKLMDTETGSLVTVGNAIFNLDLLIGSYLVLGGDDKFELVPQEGVVNDDDEFENTGMINFSYGCPATSYNLKFGIKFKRSGGHLIYLNKDNPGLQILFTADSDCSIHNTIPPPADAAIGSISFSYGLDDMNRDVFEAFVEENNILNDVSGELEALADKVAYFVKVE